MYLTKLFPKGDVIGKMFVYKQSYYGLCFKKQPTGLRLAHEYQQVASVIPTLKKCLKINHYKDYDSYDC